MAYIVVMDTSNSGITQSNNNTGMSSFTCRKSALDVHRQPKNSTIKFAGGHFKVCLIDLKLPISKFNSIEAQKEIIHSASSKPIL
jgi:hypothetical protein